VTEIAEMLETMRRIEKHLAHIASLLDGVIKHGEAAPFVEWAEPPERKDQA
jgi:hypothetical protein